MIYLNKILFSYYPYFAISVFIICSIYRYENSQYSWKSSSSQIMRKDLLVWGSNMFHLGIIFLMFGHFFGLITPKSVYTMFITTQQKQALAVYFGGTAGLICLIGLIILIYRRFFDIRIYENSSFSDLAILIILLFQLVLGLLSIKISYQHMENPASMISLANWVQGIFTLSPNLYLYVINEHWIFKAHIILGMTILLLVPFTRLIHVFSFPYLYFFREGFQIVRSFKI